MKKTVSTIQVSVLICLIFFSLTREAAGKVILPSLFSDNMVFQQKTNAAIWGGTDAGKTVTVITSWNAKKYTSVADQAGKWEVSVKTPSYGGPYTISISDGEIVTLENILIGEVWMCSGQSNMEMPLAGWGKINNYEKEIADADYPDIRLLQAEHVTSNQLKENAQVANNGWQSCSPQSIPGFSSTAYFFAREIYKNTKVPVGLIQSAWGGTIIEAWISGTSLKKMPAFTNAVTGLENEQPVKNTPNRPTVLYNGMIHPFIKFPIKGAIWYQGESNEKNALQYYDLLPGLIADWRKSWNIGDFPFYLVQLANYKKADEQPAQSAWAEIRDAQLKASSLPHTGMAVIIDIGDAGNIHPKNKQEVGRRLALLALAKTYGKKIAFSGPVFRSRKIEKDKIKLTFKSMGGILKASDDKPITGFAIAGPDQKFHWAKAVIEGNKIIVSSDEVPNPVAVRYAWANNPVCNLVNDAGLPASPFRTDDWLLPGQ